MDIQVPTHDGRKRVRMIYTKTGDLTLNAGETIVNIESADEGPGFYVYTVGPR